MIEPKKDAMMFDQIKTRTDKFVLNSDDEDVKRPATIVRRLCGTLWVAPFSIISVQQLCFHSAWYH